MTATCVGGTASQERNELRYDKSTGAKIMESSKPSDEKDTCTDSRPTGLDSVVSAQLGTLRASHSKLSSFSFITEKKDQFRVVVHSFSK